MLASGLKESQRKCRKSNVMTLRTAATPSKWSCTDIVRSCSKLAVCRCPASCMPLQGVDCMPLAYRLHAVAGSCSAVACRCKELLCRCVSLRGVALPLHVVTSFALLLRERMYQKVIILRSWRFITT
ncbi:hypothetical protein Y032_0771g2224 [Ancylostoma ceylanicum]|uniref:Uncharacterized protein n=1 Tax=Ancylostoma ceylanicum TaxID=53326 RepID=A0A016WDL9_9BILA|nr:hypothetical protein Y032_0771g2224 [Ancylostoma ceylanicum]